MRINNKAVLLLIMLVICGLHLAAEEVLATNSWTAAFVQMAGGTARQLAPSDMEHPPEYELKPSDVKKINDADLLVYAGYEVLMKTVFDSFAKPEEQTVKIITSYSPDVLEKSVLSIAEKLGTLPEAKKNIEAYRHEFESAADKLKAAGLFGVPVLVQFHQEPLARALGFEILGVFGPQPLEVGRIAKFGKLKPRLIIDNVHSPMAAPLEEILGIKAVELVNFPGFSNADGTVSPETLTGVLKYNVVKLIIFQ